MLKKKEKKRCNSGNFFTHHPLTNSTAQHRKYNEFKKLSVKLNVKSCENNCVEEKKRAGEKN